MSFKFVFGLSLKEPSIDSCEHAERTTSPEIRVKKNFISNIQFNFNRLHHRVIREAR